MTSIRRRVISRLRRREQRVDAIGVRRGPDGLTMTIAAPTRARMHAQLTAPGTPDLPIEVERRGNVALVTIRADVLSRAAATNRIVMTAHRRRWTVGRSSDVGRPPVTMPATALHLSGAEMVTTRLTDHKGASRLHVMRWTA